MDFMIENPVQQNFTPVETSGSYMTLSKKQPKMTLQEYYKMATSSKYECPKNLSHEEMERKYWKNLQPHFVPPIYGCDVDNVISDPDLEVSKVYVSHLMADLRQDINSVSSFSQCTTEPNLPKLRFGLVRYFWEIPNFSDETRGPRANLSPLFT